MVPEIHCGRVKMQGLCNERLIASDGAGESFQRQFGIDLSNQTTEPADTGSGHEFVTDPGDGLLYCTKCPMVAYDLADAATEPECPLPLESWSA